MKFLNAPKNHNNFVYLGPWSSATTYKAGDIVSKSTYLYYSLSTNTNLDPPANTSDWMVINFVPSNTGTSGQILTKTGALDTNYSWQNPPAATIDKHNVIARWDATVTYTDHDMAIDAYGVPWASLQNNNINHATPLDGTSANAWWGFPPLVSSSTGTAGQVLTKNGSDWSDYGWGNPPAAFIDRTDVVAKWSAVTEYANGDIVTDANGNIWMSTDEPNLNNTPAALSDWWSLATDIYREFIDLNNNIYNQNTAVGVNALNVLGTSKELTAIGYEALMSNNPDLTQDAGRYNTAVGYRAMRANTIGHHNTSMGWSSMAANTTGIGNTAVGEDALMSNTVNGGNSAVGAHTLYLSTGANNTAIGGNALSNNTTGFYNTAIGADTGISNFGGIGTVQTDDKLTFVGALASVDKSVNTGPFTNSTAVGYGAKVNKSNMVRLGNSSTVSVESNGNFETLVNGVGFVSKSPDGTRHKIVIEDDGAINVVNLTTSAEKIQQTTLYGTGNPPDPTTLREGTIYIKYI